MAVTSYGRNKNHDDEIKKPSRTSPDVQFKEFSLTLQATRPRTDNERIGKTIGKTKKNQMKKKQKKNKINVKMLLGRTKTISEMCNFDSNKKLGPE